MIEWLSLLKEVHQDGRSCLDSNVWGVCVFPLKQELSRCALRGDIPTSGSLCLGLERGQGVAVLAWGTGSLQDHPAATCPAPLILP